MRTTIVYPNLTGALVIWTNTRFGPSEGRWECEGCGATENYARPWEANDHSAWCRALAPDPDPAPEPPPAPAPVQDPGWFTALIHRIRATNNTKEISA
ncbi:hypothetical protein GCM10010156_76500 [Planobispora rosea]|uniref:Uncharacterized protein n=1 Tax=Planobispora rosea TaxID=35762 RepID=A0A8J3SCI8_PLARO|nr:hypothetical protein [Planobispora rosea]GGT08120.1 hypothetical protein GCM10010156_76500 [Planobispora rosea]GIH89319.1 hypothetical protein Pro02_77270 [Planobispora rosea]